MNTLIHELVQFILHETGPYGCIARRVCKQWNSLLGSTRHSVKELWLAIASHNHLNLAKWLAEHQYTIPQYVWFQAASYEHKDFLLWKPEAWIPAKRTTKTCNPCKPSVPCGAGVSQDLEMIEWIHQRIPQEHDKWFYLQVYYGALMAGSINVAEWAEQRNPKINKRKAHLAAGMSGTQAICEWLVSQGDSYSARMVSGAILDGHGYLAKWLVENNAPVDNETIHTLAVIADLTAIESVIEFLLPRCPNIRALVGGTVITVNRFEIAKKLYEGTGRWSCGAFYSALSMGNKDAITYMLNMGMPWPSKAILYAVSSNNLELVKWLRDEQVHGPESLTDGTHRAFEEATLYDRSKHEYVFNKPLNPVRGACPLDYDCCYIAAWEGHLEMLKWCVDNGCELTHEAYEVAKLNKHTHILEWLAEAHSYTEESYQRDLKEYRRMIEESVARMRLVVGVSSTGVCPRTYTDIP